MRRLGGVLERWIVCVMLVAVGIATTVFAANGDVPQILQEPQSVKTLERR